MSSVVEIPSQQLKRAVQRRLPMAVRAYRRHVRPRLQREFRGLSMAERFENIYHTNRWGDPDSRSGHGSNLRETNAVRQHLPRLLEQLGVSVMLDAPCGDFHWMQTLDLPVRYIGIDIVREIVEHNQQRYGSAHRRFLHADITAEDLPAADLILCRDGLVHLSSADVGAALTRFLATGARYLLTTTFTEQGENYEIESGHWRPLNLRRPPFNFPPPVHLIPERPTWPDEPSDKSLGLWRTDELDPQRIDVA